MKQFKQRFWTYRTYVVLAPFLERANKLFFCVNHLVEKIILQPALHVQHVHHVLPFGMKQIYITNINGSATVKIEVPNALYWMLSKSMTTIELQKP